MPTPHHGQPRYRVIADKLRERIESGVIPPGALLPAESALTSEFRASRGTVRKAIDALRKEGLAHTEHGRGTFVRAYSYDHDPDRCSGSETKRREVAADAELASLFGIEVGATLIEDESVTRRDRGVERVARVYRLRSTDHWSDHNEVGASDNSLISEGLAQQS
ncbi:GntR family transcriptional regulator [Micromonospora sp. BL4]|uniref:GntR family transcriptional regulator n=1 Tax=Micromonospora sp. BL4 TaxID=2478710 RepID=UPI00131525C1